LDGINGTLIVTIIVAALSFLGTILLGLIQTRNSKSQAKKTDVEAYTTLVDSITKRTDTEFNIMKGINNSLREQIVALEKDKVSLQLQVNEQALEIAALKERLEKCEDCINKEDKNG
jgi:preprotein translocase subunit SecG